MEWVRKVKSFSLDDSFLPTKKQIKNHIFNENNIKEFEKKIYRKAILIIDGNIIKLKSYDTIVAEYNGKTKKLKIFGWFSTTTASHINEFIEYLGGVKRLSKKELNEEPTIKI